VGINSNSQLKYIYPPVFNKVMWVNQFVKPFGETDEYWYYQDYL
jgi:hypothetical protein